MSNLNEHASLLACLCYDDDDDDDGMHLIGSVTTSKLFTMPHSSVEEGIRSYSYIELPLQEVLNFDITFVLLYFFFTGTL